MEPQSSSSLGFIYINLDHLTIGRFREATLAVMIFEEVVEPQSSSSYHRTTRSGNVSRHER